MVRTPLQFIREQGVNDADVSTGLYTALMFQPRAVGSLLVVGSMLQSAWFFAALSAILWWSAVVPAHNPFDATYNLVIARRLAVTRLASGTAARRFAAALAGTLALAISGALVADARLTASLLEAIFAIAVSAVVFARFCAGTWLYRLMQAWRRTIQLTARHRENRA